MAILDILTYGNPLLRIKAEAVLEVTDELADLAEDMLDTMYDAPGIGLAAPQIGKSIQLIVVDVSTDENPEEPYILFNPKIIPESEPIPMEEGCLSVPGVFAEVIRPEIITVKAMNIDGEPVEYSKIDGMLSRCIQHEIDHLNGILFVDKLKPTDKALYESKLKKMARSAKRP